MPKTNDGSFDCLAFKAEVQDAIYEETKALSRDEFRAYFRKRAATGPFAHLWSAISTRRRSDLTKAGA